MWMGVTVSLLMGVTIVASRTVNARLAAETSVWKSTLYNYLTGLLVSLLAVMLLGRQEMRGSMAVFPGRLWMYGGGVFGVMVVALSNLILPKTSSFAMTLFLFAGQMLTGLLLDMLLQGTFSWLQCAGGLLVLIGLFLSVWGDRRTGEDPS